MNAPEFWMLGIWTSSTEAPSCRRVARACSNPFSTSGSMPSKKYSRGTPTRSPRTPRPSGAT